MATDLRLKEMLPALTDRIVETYEEFNASYSRALSREPHGQERIGAVADGLADFYVRAGRIDQAIAWSLGDWYVKPNVTMEAIYRRSLTLPAATNDVTVLADAAVSLLDRVEHDRPVRLLGVRLEMVEPEGGY